MAQLIKLQDYISRYEWDAYRYPTQYIRLKQDSWKKLHHNWSNPEKATQEKEELPETKTSGFFKVKNYFKKEELDEEVNDDDHSSLDTEIKLKQYFLDKLFHFQLKWATSTVTERSFINTYYYEDPTLKYFLQRFPDIYLIMYDPIFTIKNALVDSDIILISPIGIEIIHLVEEHSNAVVIAGDERSWLIDTGKHQTKILNPLIALKRTEKLIKSILHFEENDFPIQKTILSRTNKIVYSSEPYHTQIVDKHHYETWFREKRNISSPLKSRQLKITEILLRHCQTTSVKRPEWEEDIYPTIGNED